MAGKRQWRTEEKRSWLAWCLTLAWILVLLLQVDATPRAEAEAPSPPDQPHRAPFRPDTRQPLPPGTGFLPPTADLPHINGQQMARGAAQQVLPDEFDWRDVDGRSYVTPIRDQGTCGACYAFGLLASFESRLLIDAAGIFDLSENHAKECNWRERNNFQYPDPGDYWGSCSGGNALMVASLLSQTGTVLEAHDPYVPRDVACNASPYQKTLLDWRIISTDQVASTQVLKQYLLEYGPLITSMYADRPSFYSYDGSYTVNYSAPAGVTDHSVLIVGWSNNLPPVAGSLQPAQGWIVKNSWGTGWGDEGYFYITYGAANIGSWSSYVDNWQHYDPNGAIWFYDDDGWGENWGNSTTAWGLVRFIPDRDTWASRVEFWISDAAMDVDVYLYDDFDGYAPSGLLASKLDLYFTEAGYHSVRLKKPPAVHAGDDVVVVIKFTNTSFPFPIAADPNGPIERARTYYSHSGSPGTWVDMGTVYNTDVAIRLRTSTGPAPAPILTSITPNTAINNGVVQISNLTGSHFQPGANVKLSRSGQPDVPGTDITVASQTKITCKFDVTGAAPGSWDVVVTNPDGQSATLANGFTVTEAVNPQVDSITPNSSTNDGPVHISDLAGAHFQPGAGVKLSRSGQSDIPASNVVVAGPSQITCDLNLNGAATGAWDVVVTNPDGLSGRLVAGFVIVEPPPPRVYSIFPSVGTNDGVTHVTNLAGDHFRSGSTVQLVRTGMGSIWATDVVVVNPSQIRCDFDLAGATTGQWDVLVTNPSGRSGSLAAGFVVTSPTAPVVESITPRSAPNTGPVHMTQIAGQRFQDGAVVKLTKPGQPDIPATNVVVVSSTQITCDLDLTGAAGGNWSVQVTNPGGESGTLVRGFLIVVPGQTNVAFLPLTRRHWPAAVTSR